MTPAKAVETLPTGAAPAGKPRAIPSLDGLRAISILLVVFAHASSTAQFPAGLPRWVTDHGSLGVQIFFVISGFLITSLLLEEKDKFGRISLRLFYIRRTLRIFPAFYAFFLVTLALCALDILALPRYNLLHALTYTMNYANHGVWWTGHLWSLSVEEQFYLAWPALLCLIGTRSALVMALWVAIGSPVILGILNLLRVPLTIWFWFPFVADSIAAGCVFAGTLPALLQKGWFLAFLRSPWGAAVPLLIVLLDCLRPQPDVFLPLGELLINLGILYCIARFTILPGGAMGRFLNWKPMVFLGALSYSLYLWQQPFLNRYVQRPWTAFPLNCVCAFTVAVLSYFLLEKPLLRLRRRFQPAWALSH